MQCWSNKRSSEDPDACFTQVLLSRPFWWTERWWVCSCTSRWILNRAWSSSTGRAAVCGGKSAASHASGRWRAAGVTAGPATASGERETSACSLTPLAPLWSLTQSLLSAGSLSIAGSLSWALGFMDPSTDRQTIRSTYRCDWQAKQHFMRHVKRIVTDLLPICVSTILLSFIYNEFFTDFQFQSSFLISSVSFLCTFSCTKYQSIVFQ